MWRLSNRSDPKADHDPDADAVVLQVVVPVMLVAAAWAVGLTQWGRAELFDRGGFGRPLSKGHMFEVALPGLNYYEVNAIDAPRWHLHVRRSVIVWWPALTLAAWLVGKPVSRSLRKMLRDRAARVSGSRARCRICGYDLRATPDRCPECGTAAPESS